MVASYAEFLESKRLTVPDQGFEVNPDALNPMLFPFQAAIVRWALRKGRAAIFAECGLGKGSMSLEWADQIVNHTSGKVLILAPLAVAQQFVREAAKFGYPITLCRTNADVSQGINVTNYERLHLFDTDRFIGVVCDECFAPDTLIDTTEGKKYIKDIRCGDKVLNAVGVDTVQNVHRREISFAIRISINGRRIISSPNHPYFTQRGWVGAQDLQPGDSLIPTAEALRMVRTIFPEVVNSSTARRKVLQQVLFSEVADAATSFLGERPYAGSGSAAWQESSSMAGIGQSESASGNRASTLTQSRERSRGTSQNLPPIDRDEAQTFRAWGERSWFDDSSVNLAGCTRTDLDCGISFIVGQTNSGLSQLLQTGLSQSRSQNRHRSGWILSPIEESTRSQANDETEFVRVDGLEVLEPGHPDLECYRDADGSFYFYDLGCTLHPSFSVGGFLVHNSSIMKSMDGKTRMALMERFRNTPYKLAGTATPAPNDHVELGSQAEFLGIQTRQEMLAQFFTHDGGDTSKWRLKGHTEGEFWKWVCTWSVMLRKPSDIGFSDEGFILPPLVMHEHVVESTYVEPGMLFSVTAQTLNEQRKARRNSLSERVVKCAELVKSDPDSQWLVFCDLNDESAALTKLIPGAVEVKGADSPDHKEVSAIKFADGQISEVVTKASIFGFGLNLQNCHNIAFVGVSHSYEMFYQAIRRCWRFGQKNAVQCHVITSSAEGAVVANLQRKEVDAQKMIDGMIAQTHEIATQELKERLRNENSYVRQVVHGAMWTAHLGDCVEVTREMAENSIDYTIYSPPFSALYTYSNSERDLGNVRDYTEFAKHFRYLAVELFRTLKPGRLMSVHCMDIPLTASMGEEISLLDFPGHLIRIFLRAGFSWHSKVTIWKDPVTAMQRTHALGLLYKQLKKDSARSRQGVPDYLLTFRKPGINPDPVTKDPAEFPVSLWQNYASPVWMDIDMGRTLSREAAREQKDERHIAPLQLDVIERAIKLWTNPGDLVLTPFLGIGSELYMAVKMGRRGIGAELKTSYWRQAVKNLEGIEAQSIGGDMFSMAGIAVE